MSKGKKRKANDPSTKATKVAEVAEVAEVAQVAEVEAAEAAEAQSVTEAAPSSEGSAPEAASSEPVTEEAAAPLTPETEEAPAPAAATEEKPAPKMAARRKNARRRSALDPVQPTLPEVDTREVPEASPSVEDLATWHGFDPETTVDLRNAPDLFAPLRDDAAPPPTVPPPDGASLNHHLRGLLEALIFASDKPIKTSELARSAKAQIKEVRDVLAELRETYSERGIVLHEVAGGWLFRTSVVYAPFVRDLTGQKPVKLTRAQLETLAILAYRQPITRPEIDEIRGVDSGAVLKMLLERDFIRILGKKDEVGRPILYGTTPVFLEFFNLKSLKDMPTLKEFTELNEESRIIAERELGESFDVPTAVAGETLADSGDGGTDLHEGPTDDPNATEWSSPIEPDDVGEREANDEALDDLENDAEGKSTPDSDPDTEVSPRKLDDDDDDEDADEDDAADETVDAPTRADDADDADVDDADAEDGDDDSRPKVSAADEEEFPDDDDSEFDDDDDDDDEDDEDDDDGDDDE